VLEFRLLGPLEVLRDGEPVALGPPRQRQLLAFLLLRRGAAATTEELLDALWGEPQPPAAKAALHNAVSALRRALGADSVQTRRGAYAIRVEPGGLDVARFEELLADARRRRGGRRRAYLVAALALFRGAPLEDFAHEPWAREEIVRLEELQLAALEDRLDCDVALGRHAEAVAELEALVLQHPLRERLWHVLMLALYRSGRQGDALAAYRRAHRAFADELGIEPGVSLRELQRAILVQDTSLHDEVDPFERAADLLPTDAAALLDYATALAERARGMLAAQEADPSRDASRRRGGR
jgi:DNA-binding SARP family transcriptional activator